MTVGEHGSDEDAVGERPTSRSTLLEQCGREQAAAAWLRRQGAASPATSGLEALDISQQLTTALGLGQDSG